MQLTIYEVDVQVEKKKRAEGKALTPQQYTFR
jgi:hypothetical protein